MIVTTVYAVSNRTVNMSSVDLICEPDRADGEWSMVLMFKSGGTAIISYGPAPELSQPDARKRFMDEMSVDYHTLAAGMVNSHNEPTRGPRFGKEGKLNVD